MDRLFYIPTYVYDVIIYLQLQFQDSYSLYLLFLSILLSIILRVQHFNALEYEHINFGILS